MASSKPTGGTWKVGREGTIVSDAPCPDEHLNTGRNHREYYGGLLIAESVMVPADAKLMVAAPVMKEALEAIRDYEPGEVVKDEFAYDRMVEAFRAAARAGLGMDEEDE